MTNDRAGTGRWPRRLLGLAVVLAVLGGGAVVAAPVLDGAARGLAERRVAQELVRETGATGSVEVSIGGGWFAPQALRGDYPQVAISAHGVPVGDGLRLERVDADLRGVEVSLRELVTGGSIRVASSRAEVELAYPVLNTYLGTRDLPLEVAPKPGGGLLGVTGSTRLLGRDIALSADVDLEVVPGDDGGELRAVPRELDTGSSLLDRLSRTVLKGFRQQLAFTVPLEELPLGQRLTGVEVRSGGVVVTTEGSALVLGA